MMNLIRLFMRLDDISICIYIYPILTYAHNTHHYNHPKKSQFTHDSNEMVKPQFLRVHESMPAITAPGDTSAESCKLGPAAHASRV